ncbi:DUF835 domain-containing protein [Thermococcus sp.]|uniref:DUF835 domain-containing protein n=1 Tax=Thermococcus sp. TaxID=35749 RepID=UPI00260C06F3|nr:DUF835 domain-containing protein [Thermococcus sp.]
MGVSPDLGIMLLKAAISLAFVLVFLKSRRKSALLLGAGWALSGNLPLGGTVIGNTNLDPLIMGLATSTTIFGIMELIREERGRGPPKAILLSLPPIPLLYGIVETALGTNFGGTYVLSGFLLIAGGGTFIEFLKEYYHERAVLFGMALILAGLASMAYPFIYLKGEIHYTLVFYGSLFIAAFTIFAYYKLIFSEDFSYLSNVKEIKDDPNGVKPGVTILSLTEFKELHRKLEKFPVLAFVRNIEPYESWIAYRVSSVEGGKVMPPTALYRITQAISEYLVETEKKGIRGLILIDSLELLKIYNGFEALLKFLATIRDLVKLSNASLITITEKEAWSNSEWKLLQRILD